MIGFKAPTPKPGRASPKTRLLLESRSAHPAPRALRRRLRHRLEKLEPVRQLALVARRERVDDARVELEGGRERIVGLLVEVLVLSPSSLGDLAVCLWFVSFVVCLCCFVCGLFVLFRLQSWIGL